ncbi:MAG TPA: ATP-binding protein [Chitinophagaceae bacterium]|nr:ATP-binding protein [Chitinophagaceae bacterium]
MNISPTPSTKNPTPQQLSLFTALCLSIPIGVSIYLIYRDEKVASIFFIATLLSSYALFQYTLRKFIYRKIKLIYKYIYQTKANKKEEVYNKYVLPAKNIDEVTQEVEQWAEQRKAEIEMLKQNEVYRKEFLQNLAHEIKTPIFAIQGYIDILLDEVPNDQAPTKKFLENTARNVERMVNLVNDLDEITKLESGEQPLHKESFIIQNIIREVFDALSIQIAERNITCSIKKGCELPITVFADKEKIRQVIINTVINAVRYGKENGSIIISVYKTDDQHVLIEVSDDGVGIAEEHLPRLFERFYRADRNRSRQYGGSGLGLAICKHIIEAHDQAMHIRSKVGVGTTIGFTLLTKKES